MSTLCLIACAAKKLNRPAPARDLYTSPLFRLHYAYAQRKLKVVPYILSAKHGVVAASDIIEPYDQTLNDMATAEVFYWAKEVAIDVARLHREHPFERLVILAGKRYYELLLGELEDLLPSSIRIETPFSGLTIGKRLQALQQALSV